MYIKLVHLERQPGSQTCKQRVLALLLIGKLNQLRDGLIEIPLQEGRRWGSQHIARWR